MNDLAFSFDAAAQFLTLQKGGHIMVLEEVIITLLAGFNFQSYMSHSPSVSVLLFVSSVNNFDEQVDVVYVELMTSPIYSFEL